MTLYRQLLIAILVLFFVLFSGTLVVNFQSTRIFLVEQLQSHAQDTATHLGLSLSVPVAGDDDITTTSMIDALFDRGYYSEIVLTDSEGEVVIRRQLGLQLEGVPDWFSRRLQLQSPSASALVMNGWVQVGSVSVTSHPGYAYRELWRTFTNMLIWFVACGIGVALLGGLILKLLFRPLRRVEKQADALCKRRYVVQEPLPRTRELRRVVEAMNRMTQKVRAMFEEQAATAGRLQALAYRDSLTGLGNRRFFEAQLNACLKMDAEAATGILMLVQLADLAEINDRRGFEAGDELIRGAAEILGSRITAFKGTVLARLGGADFGILAPGVEVESGTEHAEELVRMLADLHARGLTLGANVSNIGLAMYDPLSESGKLLAEADLALRAAQSQGGNRAYLYRASSARQPEVLGRQAWQAYLTEVFRKGSVILFQQPVVSSASASQILHREILARIPGRNGDPVPAAVFMPMAEQLGLAGELDRQVLRGLREFQGHHASEDATAINLSTACLRDAGLMAEICGELPDASRGPKIYFEFPEFHAVQDVDQLREFVDRVKAAGHGFGLDHFGREFSTFGYLHSLRPDYVKIDRALLHDVVTDRDAQFLVRTLCSVAHSLDIQVIAEAVEDHEQWEILKELNVDGIQGYIVARPAPLDR